MWGWCNVSGEPELDYIRFDQSLTGIRSRLFDQALKKADKHFTGLFSHLCLTDNLPLKTRRSNIPVEEGWAHCPYTNLAWRPGSAAAPSVHPQQLHPGWRKWLHACPGQAGQEAVNIQKLCDFVSMVSEIIYFASHTGSLGWPHYYTTTNKKLSVSHEPKVD